MLKRISKRSSQVHKTSVKVSIPQKNHTQSSQIQNGVHGCGRNYNSREEIKSYKDTWILKKTSKGKARAGKGRLRKKEDWGEFQKQTLSGEKCWSKTSVSAPSVSLRHLCSNPAADTFQSCCRLATEAGGPHLDS